MNKSIALIGAGQLGSRHLQSLALLPGEAHIFVIDPSAQMRDVAKARFQEVAGHERHQVKYLASLSELDQMALDLAVVATNSAIRAQVVSDLLSRANVSYLILEKFLFQRKADYQEIGLELKKTGTKCFVNCPRRMYPTYSKLYEMLAAEAPLHMEVVGNNWGMGCNGIHFIDLFQYLSGEAPIHWKNELEPGTLESKRPGYIEFAGRISGIAPRGSTLSLTSFLSGKPNTSLRISTPAHRLVINESLGKVWHESVSEQQVNLEELDFSMLHQSQMTHLVATQLFEKGECQLTPYEDSVSAHLPFLQLMLEHYNLNRTEKTDLCPIT